MEQTFMTIHNLSPDANILFASDSVVDILGYQPDEIRGRSCFDFFHPDEVPFARSVHRRGILLDKAAVLHYARVLSESGRWVSCECCFTVVHDVLVASTSVYHRGERSERRALEAPQIRRLFSCSPRDPRYHMLEHLSPKFKMPPMEREPRAALILNRFTRNLTVMFATNAISSVFGLHPEEIRDKSFYRCIQENCLPDALRCLEGAKENDSIAYLRFWSRDPRQEDTEGHQGNDDHGGGGLEGPDNDSTYLTPMEVDEYDLSTSEPRPNYGMGVGEEGASPDLSSGRSTGNSSNSAPGPRDQVYQPSLMPYALDADSSTQTTPDTPRSASSGHPTELLPSIELEAVVSCTSDGLVVVLRKARPPIPVAHPPLLPLDYENGLFAAPWAQQPIRPCFPPEMLYRFQPPLLPQYMPLRENLKAAGGPPLDQLMRSIRDVAVFAWALVGINSNFAAYGHGLPNGEALPPKGRSSWDYDAGRQASEDQGAPQWGSRVDKGKAPAREPVQLVAPASRPEPRRSYGRTTTAVGSNDYTYAPSSFWPQSSRHSEVPENSVYRNAFGAEPIYQHQLHCNPVQTQAQMAPRPTPLFYGAEPEPRAEATHRVYPGGFVAPTPQTASPEESHHIFHYPWQ